MRWLLLLSFALLFAGCRDMARTWWKVLDDEDNAPASSTGASTVKLVHSAPSAVEGQVLWIHLVRTNPDGAEVSTEYETVATGSTATARAGVDYTPVQGALRWAANEGGVKSIAINLLLDSVYEGSETLFVRFFNQRGRVAVTGVFATILDKNRAPLLAADVTKVSAVKGGVQRLSLRAGVAHGNRSYFLAGSLGTRPGVVVGGVHVPLNPDAYMQLTIAYANQGPFFNTAGLLGVQGEGRAEIRVPILSPSLIGLRLYHAYVVHDNKGAVYLASNAVELALGL